MRLLAIAVSCMLLAVSASAGENGWTELLTKDFKAWRDQPKNWLEVAEVALDPQKANRLLTKMPGAGVHLNGANGNAGNLVTRRDYQDLEVHVEFLIPKGSNSGIKFMGLYEIQIYDSFGKKELTGSDGGGIYPRAELQPRYRTIDKGVPPRVNACKPPGEWQTLDAIFKAPRFDDQGKKIANARLVKAVLNGEVIHEDVDLPYPTGNFWNTKKEIPLGPFYVQADHGPIAFRSIRVRELTRDAK